MKKRTDLTAEVKRWFEEAERIDPEEDELYGLTAAAKECQTGSAINRNGSRESSRPGGSWKRKRRQRQSEGQTLRRPITSEADGIPARKRNATLPIRKATDEKQRGFIAGYNAQAQWMPTVSHRGRLTNNARYDR
jgi:hypothetical protein